MAISAKGVGTWVAVAGFSGTATLPAHAAGDMLIVRAACKPYGLLMSCSTAGWSSLGTATNGTTAAASGVGSLQIGSWYRIATSSAETNPVIDFSTGAGGDPGTLVAVVYQKGAGDTWVTPVNAKGGDSTLRTAHTATMSTHVSATAGDMLDFFTVWSDNYAATVPNVTQAGLTLDTVVEYPATALNSTIGGDSSADGGYRLVTAGTSSAAAVVTGTLGNAEEGISCVTRLRVTSGPVTHNGTASWSDTSALTATAVKESLPSYTGTAQSDFVATAVSGPPVVEHLGTASWSAQTSFTATGLRNALPTFAGSAQTTWTATGSRNALPTAAWSAQTGLVATAVKTVLPSASWSDTSSLTATAVKGSLPTAALSAEGVFTATGVRGLAGSTAWSAETSWAATAQRNALPTAAFTAESSFTATADVVGSAVDHQGSAAWSGEAVLAATAVKGSLPSAAFSGQSTFTATAVVTVLPAAVTRSAQTTFTATAVKTVLPTAAYSDTSVFTATAVKGSLGSAAWTAQSAWTATSVAGAVASATLTGESSFTATATLNGAAQEHFGTTAWSATGSLTATAVGTVLPELFLRTYPDNAIRNGDFEVEWSPASESTFYTNVYGGTAARSTVQAHSGSYSLKLQQNVNTNKASLDVVADGLRDWDDPGHVMTLSAWVWIPSGLGITKVRVGGEYGNAWTEANLSLLDQWQQVSWSIPASWGWTYNIGVVEVAAPVGAAAHIYIDDMMWERAASASSTYIPYKGWLVVGSVQTVAQGSAAWSAQGTLSPTAVLETSGSAAFSGQASSTFTGAKGPAGTADWSSTGTVSYGTPQMDRVATAEFSAEGSLSAAPYQGYFASLSMAANSTFTALGTTPLYTWFFTPPGMDTEDWRGSSWHRLAGGRRVGVTLLRINGEYVSVRNPTAHAVSLADRVYPGGRVYELSSRAEANELVAAGFSVDEVEL